MCPGRSAGVRLWRAVACLPGTEVGTEPCRRGRLTAPRSERERCDDLAVSDAPASAPSASAKRLTLIATILGSSIAILDSSVVSVALPSIQRSLGGGLAGQQWVTNAYLLTLGSLILLGGSLGDIFGERRIFALGVGGFGVASLLCAIAPTIGLLVAFRAVQGVAGALLTPSSLAVIVATFPSRERGPAIGTWTAWGTIAGALGPLVAGLILNVASWRWIFVINLPLVVGCLWLIRKAVPDTRPMGAGRKVDVTGALLGVLGLGGTVFALIEQPQLGWSNPAVTGTLIGGIVLFIAFLVYESRTPDPMLRLDLFKSRNFAVGNVETLAIYGGLSALFFFLVLYLQQVAGYTPLESGLALLPESIVMFLLSSRFGALADRFGPRLFMGLGPVVAGAGMLMFLGIGIHVSYLGTVLPAILVFSLGLSMTVAPLTAAVLAGVKESEAGIGSAVNNAVARVAGLIATVTVGALVAAQFATSLGLARRLPARDRRRRWPRDHRRAHRRCGHPEPTARRARQELLRRAARRGAARRGWGARTAAGVSCSGCCPETSLSLAARG